MVVDDDETKKLKARRDYYDEWLRRYKHTTQLLPEIQKQRDITDWELKALSNRPDESNEIYLDLNTKFQLENQYIIGALPMMAEYNFEQFIGASALSASGTASVYEFVSRVGDLGTQEASQYAIQYTHLYQELQATQNRTQEVRSLVSKLSNPQTLERFDRAANAVAAARLDVGQRTAAAFDTRTFLDGVQGDLFNLARKWPKENMTWETMAERLAKGGTQSAEALEIRSQEAKRSSLVRRLSDIGKDREAGTLTDIGNIWTQMLEHIYTVLGLVNFVS